MKQPLLPRRRDKSLPFIPSNKNLLGERLLTRALLLPSLKRAFGGVYAYVEPASVRAAADKSVPLIFCLTHSGWWDGHVAYVLNRHIFRRESYLMMEDHQLVRYFFFTWAGVFGVDRHDGRKALASIEYITRILREEPGSALWMFPQGTMVHPEKRPIGIFGGAAHIARRLGRCALVPVAIRYEFIMDQAPDVYTRVGSPIFVQGEVPLAREITALLDAEMTSTADRLRDDVSRHSFDAYRRLLSGRGSINKLWDNVTRRASKLKPGGERRK